MKNTNKTSFKKNISRGALSFAVAAGISLAVGTAFADDPTSMAPPIETSAPAGFSSGTNAAADSVFNWQEIPANQQVPLTRASFDQGGYQLYDTVGETIVVPFTSENLYVMKFATSQNGTFYFENEGGYPVLYVPRGGYLENATVSGARWYPFGQDFHPVEPVFLGIAPSYDEFINLGWYPDTHCYGGFYGNTSFIEGGVFLPTVGLFFEVGSHPYYGWNDYHRYYEGHPGYYRTDYYNRDFYHYAGSHYNRFAPDRRFQGGGDYHAHDGFGGRSGSDGHSGFGGRSADAGRSGFNGRSGFGGTSGFGGNSGSGRTFRGSSSYGSGDHNSTVNRSYTANNSGSGGRSFGGSQNFGGGNSGSGRTFRGASNYGGGQSYSGGSRSYSGGQSYGGGTSSFGGGRENFSRQNYTSQNSGGGRQSFGGGNRGSFSGGSQSTRSVSGGNSGGGSRGGNSGGGNQGGGGNRGGGGGRSR